MKTNLILLITILAFCCKPENKKAEIVTENVLLKEAKTNVIENTNKIELCTVKLLDSALMIQIPKDFELMGTEMVNLKYPYKEKRPTMVYTDREGEINIAINYTNDNISVDDIAKLQASILTQFKSSPAIKLISSNYRGINGRDFFIIKFYSYAVDAQIYNLMFGTELNGKLLMGTFNCTVSKLQEWQPIADKIVNSLEVLK